MRSPSFARRSGLVVALVALVVLVMLSLGGCPRGPCEETCRRVAACRLAARIGERLPGEGAPPADATCMARCEAATEEFAACEGKRRECDAVLACIPYRDAR
jgi:hypothetical protein